MSDSAPVAERPDWGLLPESAIVMLRKREWENTSRLKNLLTGEREFPLTLSLRPPSGAQALSNLKHFQEFIQSWNNYGQQHQLVRESRRYRTLDEQQVPVKLVIDSIEALANLLGDDAQARYQHWSAVIAPVLEAPFAQAIQQGLYTALVSQLSVLDQISTDQSHSLASLLPQLTRGLGGGCYLRALPVIGIDTKFIEEHQALLQVLLDVIHKNEVSDDGGLLQWLGCTPNPKGWLCIHPLSDIAITALGGMPILQLPINVLRKQPLPAGRILVVENLESGLALGAVPDCIAVIGGGRNLQWLAAPWLAGKQVAYWGDIDTWGLTLLSEARTYCPHLTALMMDSATLLAHQDRMVIEPEPAQRLPIALTEAEQCLYGDLLSGRYGDGRLEQERLSQDYIMAAMEGWLHKLA